MDRTEIIQSQADETGFSAFFQRHWNRQKGDPSFAGRACGRKQTILKQKQGCIEALVRGLRPPWPRSLPTCNSGLQFCGAYRLLDLQGWSEACVRAPVGVFLSERKRGQRNETP